MKPSVPYGTTILRLPWKCCAKRRKNFWENDVLVTLCHAILDHKRRKISSVVDCSILKQITNEKDQIEGNQILYKMAISVFRSFGFLNPKIPKIIKKYPKPNFLKFSKKRNICWRPTCGESTWQISSHSIYFWPPDGSVQCAMSWRQNFQSQFLAVLNIVHQNKLHHCNPDTKLHKIPVLWLKQNEFQNLTFLTSFDLIVTCNSGQTTKWT